MTNRNPVYIATRREAVAARRKLFEATRGIDTILQTKPPDMAALLQPYIRAAEALPDKDGA